MRLLLLCTCIVLTSCKFVPNYHPRNIAANNLKRNPVDHLLPNGQKVPAPELKTEEEKVKELKDKLVQEKLADLAKAQAEQKEATEAATNEEQKKKKESDEEKYVKMEMGYHVPGTIVHEGKFEVDPNQYQGGYNQQAGYGGYAPQGFGYEGGYPGYGTYGMNGGYNYQQPMAAVG